VLKRDPIDPNRFSTDAASVELAFTATNTNNLPTLSVKGTAQTFRDATIQHRSVKVTSVPIAVGGSVLTFGLTFTNGLPGAPGGFYQLSEVLDFGGTKLLRMLLSRHDTQNTHFALVIDR
jgi:hypothetical protein